MPQKNATKNATQTMPHPDTLGPALHRFHTCLIGRSAHAGAALTTCSRTPMGRSSSDWIWCPPASPPPSSRGAVFSPNSLALLAYVLAWLAAWTAAHVMPCMLCCMGCCAWAPASFAAWNAACGMPCMGCCMGCCAWCAVHGLLCMHLPQSCMWSMAERRRCVSP